MPDPTSDTLDRIHARIAQAAPAGVWSRADFLDIGTPTAVEKALQRLTLRGDIRRPYRGLYDKPGVSKLTGKMVFPPRASFIDAIVRRDKIGQWRDRNLVFAHASVPSGADSGSSAA